MQFMGILHQVVELGVRCLDVLKAVGGDRAQFAPAKGNARVIRLGINGVFACRVSSQDFRRPTGPLELPAQRVLHVHQVQDCRRHVNVPHQAADSVRGGHPAGRFENQRDVQSRVVHEEAVLVFAVLA